MAKAVNSDPTQRVVAKTFFGALALAVVLGVLAFIQVADIERGILEVCATQQDGYVQLVVDQINLKENREDEEIISDILETMDASTTKYWVFSKDQTMLFVKDVTETNRYKGFSAATYWGTSDAQGFIDALQQGSVVHDFITVEGIEYLASGSVFQYDGKDFRLCLLTNRAALLDNNAYLGARSRLLVIMLVSLGLLLIIPVAIAFKTARARQQVAAEHAEAAHAYGKLHELVERSTRSELYDTRLHVWSDGALDQFLEKLVARDARNAKLVKVRFPEDGFKDDFLRRAAVLVGDSAVRFSVGDDAVLLYVDAAEDEIRSELEPLLRENAEIDCVIPVIAGMDGSEGGTENASSEEA